MLSDINRLGAFGAVYQKAGCYLECLCLTSCTSIDDIMLFDVLLLAVQDNDARERSQKQVLSLFSSDNSTEHLSNTGMQSCLGAVRSLSSFEAHCGVQYGARLIGDRGKRGTAADLMLDFAQLHTAESK